MSTFTAASNSFRIIATELPDILIIEPKIFRDERGFFLETYNKDGLAAAGFVADFVQDNHSRSSGGVLRGLHYQIPPKAQGKLVRVASGSIYDVAVDVRKSSKTYGKWFGIELSAEDMRMLWIPKGFAHGFVVLSESADLLYKTTDVYAPNYEQTLLWNDPSIAIQWPLKGQPLISKKDAMGVQLKDAIGFE